MPQLKPEDTTMIGLTLFNQLCQLARIANTSLDNPLSDEQVMPLMCYNFTVIGIRPCFFLQCFDSVGWVTGRASGL